jgi:PKD repeat protein
MFKNNFNMYKQFLAFLLIALLSLPVIAQDSKATIQQYLKTQQSELGFSDSDLENWAISSEQLNRKNQSIQIYIQQKYNDINILNAIGNITITTNGKIFFNGDAMVRQIESKINSINPVIQPEAALTIAKQSITDELNPETFATELIYNETDGALRLSWLTSFETKDHQHYYFKVVDAENGAILKEWDQVLHCNFGHAGFNAAHATQKGHFSYGPRTERRASSPNYNVFAIPAESPNHGSRSIVNGVEDPIASPFGWHDTNRQPGAEFTTTRGNNTSAYDDSNNSNSQGYAPDGGPELNFDFPIDFTSAPQVSRDAAITNLFYMTNFMHDFSYQYGFDEPNGNFQQNNYGNGGNGSDYVLAEALDGSGTNNANFSTFIDGTKPRMQMYVWTASSASSEILTVNGPAEIAGSYATALAQFGASITEVPISGDLVLLEDSEAPINDACNAVVNAGALAGKFALLDRGDCTFIVKVKAAQNAGAIGVLVVNNIEGPPTTMGGVDVTITIPSVMITNTDGAILKNALANGATINITLVNNAEELPALDGDYDNGIIAHEYTHGISNRLVGGRFNTFCLTNQEQMGEGWSDYFGLMATINLEATNPVRRPIGTYVTGESPDAGFGIRPAPYDTSFAVNGFTYANLPSNQISIPHGVGFIWCTMLWDMTWALIEEYGYDPNIYTGTGGNNIALQLVTDGMKLVNCNPGFVQARDAILRADEINNGGANQCIIWKAFARRGLGFSALQANPNNVNDGTAAFDVPPSCTDVSDLVAFTASQTIICDGSVQFTDESGVVANEWNWDFGDGNTSELQNPTHTYSESGIYSVSLSIAGDNGFGTQTVTNYITVTLPETPSNILYSDGCIGDEIFVTAEVAFGDIVWSSNEVETVADTFYITLLNELNGVSAYNQIIVNGDTCTSASAEISITGNSASFEYSVNGLIVSFTNTSDQDGEWIWNFGDGNSSTDENPIHTYAEEGLYEVTLSIFEDICAVTQTVDLQVTGILESLDESNISIAPNPTSQFAIITLNDQLSAPLNVKVFNSEGQSMPVQSALLQNNNFQLDVSNLASGHYTIQLIGSTWQIQTALIVTKNK